MHVTVFVCTVGLDQFQILPILEVPSTAVNSQVQVLIPIYGKQS